MRRKLSTSYCFFLGFKASYFWTTRILNRVNPVYGWLFRHPTTREHFKPRISPPVCFKIPANPLLQMRRTPNPENLLETLDCRSLWSGLLVRSRWENPFPLLNFFPLPRLASRLFALFPKDSLFTGYFQVYFQNESFSNCKMHVRKIKPSSWNSKSEPIFWVWKMLLTMHANKRSISFELLVKVNPAC